ncbi:hypothetical protein [Streptomyces sp. SID9124]|uniref:hypothetical protein n=1 Tax=Streptomyces sp. SID9124 TaxID=2706108 RepID=UPI0013E02EC8|nr:hypothetical protein [Streptomyces sp. SID9124]NED13151.1 hypothetical protein [Streptomyces sp. SID9124]
MRLSRARVTSAAAWLGAGLLLGLAGPVAGKFDNPVCEALNVLFSGGWPWVGYAFLVGYTRRSRAGSALLAALGLLVGVVAYYLFKQLYPALPAGVEAGPAEVGISPQILVWGTVALLFGAPVGLVGNLARTPGIGGLLFRLLVPLTAYVETDQRLRGEANAQHPVLGITWAASRAAACVVAAWLVGHTAWSWWRGRAEEGRTAGVPTDRL